MDPWKTDTAAIEERVVSEEKTEALVEQLGLWNQAYRDGKPLISDREYDDKVEELRTLDPDHVYLHTVEAESFDNKGQVRHAKPMLSTEKAYDRETLQRWLDRCLKAADQLGLPAPTIRVTPKLDGAAGHDNGTVLATRGNGLVGYDITEALHRGVVPIGGRGLGLGEIVMAQTYFETALADEFEHPRNLVVGILGSDTLSEPAKKALDAGQVHFVPYVNLACWRGDHQRFLEDLDTIRHDLRGQVDYALDGFVAEAEGEALREHMGATNHHYRWQIAIKERGETAETIVRAITWQTGRTGNVTPVLEVEPTRVSGATIQRITGHHAGLIKAQQIGPGARIQIIRSGEVIPKLEQVLEASDEVTVASECPSCGGALSWRNDFLVCTNHDACPAQVVNGLRHWFKMLGSADWFGPKSLQRLVDGGFDSLEKIYGLTEADCLNLDFGPGQSANFVEALATSRQTEVEDARFLAAFGIADLGLGDSRNLLRQFPLESLGELQAETLEAVHGFGTITSVRITEGLQARWGTIEHMLNLGFRLLPTPLAAAQEAVESPIAGKRIVFTGKMLLGTRDEMQAGARALGADVLSSVSGKTQILVAGEKASSGKIAKAEAAGAQILSEQEYLSLIGQA